MQQQGINTPLGVNQGIVGGVGGIGRPIGGIGINQNILGGGLTGGYANSTEAECEFGCLLEIVKKSKKLSLSFTMLVDLKNLNNLLGPNHQGAAFSVEMVKRGCATRMTGMMEGMGMGIGGMEMGGMAGMGYGEGYGGYG